MRRLLPYLTVALITISYTLESRGRSKRVEKKFHSREQAIKFWNNAPSCLIPRLSDDFTIQPRWVCNSADLENEIRDFVLKEDGKLIYGQEQKGD